VTPEIQGKGPKVLIACEFSGVVRDSFLRRGFNAWSCDLLPTESTMKNGETNGHLQMDVLRAIGLANWDLMIAHPPCTFLTLAGARWLYVGGRGTVRDEVRWENMLKAAAFYNRLRDAKIRRKCLENPIMHGHASAICGKPTQIIQCWQFGHAETKKTGLRLVNLPPLVPTDVIAPDFDRWPPGRGNGYEPKVHYASPGPNRGHERSRTLFGIAEAMADQWGKQLIPQQP
jgi:hypothetical protein